MGVKFKLAGAKAQEQKSGFEAYDGPIPTRRGAYRAKIRQVKLKEFNSGSIGFMIVADFEAAAGDPKDHAQFDGYTMFIQNIIVQTADGSPLKEGSQRNVDNFLYAIGVKGEDPLIDHEKGEIDKNGVKVLKIGAVNPTGQYVSIDCGTEEYGGDMRLTSNGIFRDNSDKVAPKTVKDEDPDEDEETEGYADDEEDEDGETREDELAAMTLPALKKLAKELGVTATNKAGYVEAILEAESAEDEDEGEEDAEDETEEDESEEEEEEDEESEEDEEEEEDDEAAALREELAGLARPKLVSRLKTGGGRALKSDSDDDLIEKIIKIEIETPF